MPETTNPDIFEKAARLKLRFNTSRGLLSVEDLWDLPLSSKTTSTSLDDIALGLHQQLKLAADVVSFVDDVSPRTDESQLAFDIVKHVIDTRKRENADAVTARKRAETKQSLMAALERKKEGAINDMSIEDLEKALAEL